jgi:DNA-binding transcriptional LysR family regulator
MNLADRIYGYCEWMVDEQNEPHSLEQQLARLDLNLLVSLQALLQERSVTRAAELVGLSQSAMSNALRRLRRTMNDELLIRVGNVLVPTGRAERVQVPLAQALAIIQRQVVASDRFDPASSTRTFGIVASTSTALTVLPYLLREVARDAPGIRIRLHPQEIRNTDALLRRPDIDVVLLPDLGPTTFPRERLYDERWVCVADRDTTAIGDTLSVDAYVALDRVYYLEDGMQTYPDLQLQARGRMFTPARIEVEDFLLIPFLVEGTNMIAVVQERVARRLSTSADIRILRLPMDIADLGIDMVWNPRAAGDPACDWLRGALFRSAGHSWDKWRG